MCGHDCFLVISLMVLLTIVWVLTVHTLTPQFQSPQRNTGVIKKTSEQMLLLRNIYARGCKVVGVPAGVK